MPVYRIEYSDGIGLWQGVVEIDCFDDSEAIKEAHKVDVLPSGIGFTIRHGERVVYAHAHPTE